MLGFVDATHAAFAHQDEEFESIANYSTRLDILLELRTLACKASLKAIICGSVSFGSKSCMQMFTIGK